MDKQVLAPIPLWHSVVHGMVLALSLVIISTPDVRTMAMRVAYTLLFLFVGCQAVMRMKRANALQAKISQLSQHLPRHNSFADSLLLITLTVSSLTQLLAF